MAGDPFTITMEFRDGDPEGVRVIKRGNWNGKCVFLPRENWPQNKDVISDLACPGVYVLFGGDKEQPRIYIGQSDKVRDRLESHYNDTTGTKDFWESAVAFVSTGNSLHGHVAWLEWALIDRARKANGSKLENIAKHVEPPLATGDKMDCELFLKRMLQILPLVELRAFEITNPPPPPDLDTIIVQAGWEGFEKCFLHGMSWNAVRVAEDKKKKIKWIAVYQKAPIKAITYVAPVKDFKPFGDEGKLEVFFSEHARKIGPIHLGSAEPALMRAPKYTTYDRLQHAAQIAELFPKTSIG